MHSSIAKDESTLHLNEESKMKKRISLNNVRNELKASDISQYPLQISKSITKFNLKNSLKPESKNSIIKDYLHSHKFDFVRNKTKKITVKQLKSNINKSFYSANNDNECVSMVYYPNFGKTRKKKKNNDENIKIEENKKTNLKKVENSLIDKLNNMKFNFENDSMNESNINDAQNISVRINDNKINNFFWTNKTKGGNINNLIKFAQKKSKYHSNINSNLRSSLFASNCGNNSGISEDNYEKNNDINKDYLKLTDFKKMRNKKNELTSINKSINIICKNIPMEKSRNLFRTNNLYDSFDDDESDKDDEYNGECILPSSYYILILDLLLFSSTLYSSFYLPLRMAKSDCFCIDENYINKIILYFIEILYIFDFILSFFRAYYNHQLKLVKNNTEIIIHYLKSDFFFDFIEAIPILSYSNLLCVNLKKVNYCFGYNMSNLLIFLKIVSNLKIIKIFKVRNKRKNITLNSLLNLFAENYLLEKFLDNIINGLHCFLAFHFCICLNIFIAKQTYPNWLITINSQDQNLLYNYIVSSYSLVETLTTVGYGDVVCESTFERIFQIFFLGVGVIAYSYIISSFGNLIKNESLSSLKYQENMKILEEIRIDYPNMPYKLYNKIFNYIESKKVADIKMDANILANSLPFNLRNVLLLIMYSSCIKNFKFFKGVQNSNFIIEVLSKFVSSTSKKSEILVYEGEMIEEIIIVRDGRLSLEVAIDMEEPEISIEKYFNINFEGITTVKKMKKIEEAKKLNASQLLYSKKTKDFDMAKTVLNNAVKKQVNHLLNDVCEDNSILDKTRNDIKKQNNPIRNNSKSDYLRNEPIKNEKGNFKYIKIIDIRKNENYGGLYMFLRRPSPLSLKVKSKFAELYLIPKKDIFEIANNYKNIWSKIHKKDFHNMLSIKHKTFMTLNKFIEFNGLGDVNPNDITTFDYNLTKDKKNQQITNPEKNVSFDMGHLVTCPSPVDINKNINSNFPHMFSVHNQNITHTLNNNINNVNNMNPFLQKPKQILKKNNSKNDGDNPSQQKVPFSQLLSFMANSKQNIINSNTNSNSNNNTISNNTINYNNHITNNFYLTTKKNDSSKSLSSNKLEDKQKSGTINEKVNTIIINEKSDILFPTLNAIFNDNKIETIKIKMKKSKQKEKRRRIFSLGKQMAKLFRNKNYKIMLFDNNNGETFEILNNNNNVISQNNDDINQNKINLDNIPEISTDDEYSINRFDYNDLSKEGVISFTLEAIYKNINIHTNMKYFQDKLYQEKVLNYMTQLLENKTKITSSQNIDYSGSSSFSDSFSSKNKYMPLNSIEKIIKKSSFDRKELSSNILKSSENDSKYKAIYESDNKSRKNKKKHGTNNNLFSIGSSKILLKKTNFRNTAINNKGITDLDIINKNKTKKQKMFKRNSLGSNIKFSFKFDTNDLFKNNANDKNNNSNSVKKSKKFGNLEEEKKNKKRRDSAYLKKSNNMVNIKKTKSSKSLKKAAMSPSIKKKTTKRKSIKIRNKLKLDNFSKDNGVENNNTIDYFAKEEKNGNECRIL